MGGTGKPFPLESILFSIKRGKKQSRWQGGSYATQSRREPAITLCVNGLVYGVGVDRRLSRRPPSARNDRSCAQVGELSFPNVEARVCLPFEFWPWMIKVLQTLAFLHC